MEDQGIFKTSMFGGFDKQSVLSYVDEMAQKARAREEQLLSRTEDLTQERAELMSEKNQLQDEVRDLKEKLEKLDETMEALGRHEARIQELEEQLKAAQTENAALAGRVEQGEEKGRKYDAVASQVGIVMVEAQKQGDAIVARAHQQAERVAQESIANIYELNKRVDQYKEDMYRLHAFSVQTLQSLNQQMGQIDQLVKEAEGHLYISAGNAELAGMPPGSYPVQGDYEGEAGYAPGDYEDEYAPASARQEAPQGAAQGEGDFFTEPYQG